MTAEQGGCADQSGRRDRGERGATVTAEQGGCAVMRDALAMTAGGERILSLSEQLHLSACLRCRAEQLRYRRLMDAMRSLRESPVGRDPRLETQIMARLDSRPQHWARRASARAAPALGGVAAGAAAAAGVMALAARHRRVAPMARWRPSG